MKRLALCALCAACSMSKSSESQSSYAQKVDTVTERGAVKVTTTVEDFGPASSGATPGQAVGLSGPPRPIRRITRVTERDPVVTHTDSAVAASGEAHAASASRFGIPWWLWLAGAAALVVAILALKPPWLPPALTILQRIFRRSN